MTVNTKPCRYEGLIDSVRKVASYKSQEGSYRDLRVSDNRTTEVSKFRLGLNIKKVKVPPYIYEIMKGVNEVCYDTDTDKMVWNDYPVVCDSSLKDIYFEFETLMNVVNKGE